MTANEDRAIQIRAILGDLRRLRTKDVSDDRRYAIDENIIFFEALKSPFSYLLWLFGRARCVDRKRLLELSDLSLPHWEEELHLRLIEMEKKALPGMIAPLRDAVVDFILKEHPRLVIDLGSGGMEVERQIVDRLLLAGYKQDICFIGVDRSDTARAVAKRNLETLPVAMVEVCEEAHLSGSRVKDILSGPSRQYQILLCRNDIFGLPDVFEANTAGLVFHSKLRHHLSDKQKIGLDCVTGRIGKTVIEYDNFRCWPFVMAESIAIWKYPVLLNGAVFSRLRDPSRRELRTLRHSASAISFFKIDSYLLIRKPG